MFNFIKKAGTGVVTSVSSSNSNNNINNDKDADKDKRKREKKDRKEKQKRERANMSTEELLRLDEVRRSLKIRGRRKEKEKLPSGITADYTADFLASLDIDDKTTIIKKNNYHQQQQQQQQQQQNFTYYNYEYIQSDSSETSLNSLNQQQQKTPKLPPLPPKPPKRGILKAPRNIQHDAQQRLSEDLINNEYMKNGCTIINNYQNLPIPSSSSSSSPPPLTTTIINQNGYSEKLLIITSTSPSGDSLTDTTNSSFATPPFSLSPVGESQGFHRWSRTSNFDDNINLPLPSIIPIQLPSPRILIIKRQKPPRNDFGFSLRRAMILQRNFINFDSSNNNNNNNNINNNNSDNNHIKNGDNVSTINSSNNNNNNNKNNNNLLINMKAVIFAEPGTILQHNNETGLLPGDKLLEVNQIPVENKTREEIIDLIKASGESVTLKVQPVAELSELSRRSTYDGIEIILDDSNIKGGTLKRSGSRRFNKSPKARSEIDLQNEKQWMDEEKLWLMHKNGFTLVQRECSSLNQQQQQQQQQSNDKICVKIIQTNEILYVDEDDLEKANPQKFDRCEDLTLLRNLNESSILNTLRQRYAINLIHTYVGNNNLIVINPMAPLAIYSEKVIALFKGCKLEDMPPHIYSMAQSAYYNLLSTRRDQSLVFLGRSGSGKTTNLRHCLQYLLTVTTNPSNPILTIDKLCSIWNILENFGTCRTTLNENATKFTQIFTIDYDQSGLITSANIQIFLFEKCRLCSKNNNKGTFHIMNTILNGIDEQFRKELQLDQYNDGGCFLNLLQKPNDNKQKAQNDFKKLRQSFNCLNITINEQKLIFMILGAIFHLSNAGITKINGRYQFNYPQSAQKAANLLGTTIDDLNRIIFTTTTITSSSSSTTSPTTINNNSNNKINRTPSPIEKETIYGGLDSIDAFIIGLYAELFNCINNLINRSLTTTLTTQTTTISTTMSIYLIDTPGFQNPATCGKQSGGTFDDLCNNYIQERLQLLFYNINIIMPKDRYIQENIDINFNNDDDENLLINPQSLINLLDKQPQNTMIRQTQHDLVFNENDRRGLLWLLDEEIIYPGATDETFLERLFTHYNDRDYQFLLRKAPGINQFILQHLQGTNPVLYTVKNWLKQCRENPITKQAISILQESHKEDLSKLFITIRGFGPSNFSGSLLSLDGSQSLRRASSIRRNFNGGTAVMKRKSLCLQVKFTVDGLIETLRRTKIHFIHCFLPQHNAGFCETNASLLNTIKNDRFTNQYDDGLINLPLLRSQLRGAQILETVRLYKQGFPNFLPLNEFRRRFQILISQQLGNDENLYSPILDERKSVQDMLLSLDLELSNYRIGLSQIFFRNGVLSQLESQRDEHLTDMIIIFQANCRGYLARKKLIKKKLQDLAVRCIQKNFRKFLLVKNWPWWKLLIQVTPLLNVHRTEEELRLKTEELELLKMKLEKLENERNTLKSDNEKLEAKVSELTVDLADEHSTSTLQAERLDIEQSERLKLEKDFNDNQIKLKQLQQTNDKLEMELLYTKNNDDYDIIDDDNDDEDNDDDYEHVVDDELLSKNINNKNNTKLFYKKRYERVIRELEFTKRRLQQQHEDDLEQLIGLKKQLEKKLTDAYEEVEEQKQIVGQWKRKVQRLTSEMNDLRLLLDEQNNRNNLLEKKQRKFDSELTFINDELKNEKLYKDRLQREKELLLTEKYTLDGLLNDLKLELDLKDEKLINLQHDYDELTNCVKTEEEITILRKQKIDLDRKLMEQDEELDELAGQVQLLEQSKLRLEMNLESMRKDAKKEAQLRDDEIEEIRCNAQKKLKLFEQQLENEHEERTLLLKEKHELERRLQNYLEIDRNERAGDEQLVQKLKRDLKRTKILLRDTQLQLEKQKSDNPNKLMIRQLKNQLEDLESSKNLTLKLKQSLENDLSECQTQLDDTIKIKKELDLKCCVLMRERSDLQLQLEENEEEMSELLKKYKQSVQQMSLDQIQLQEQVALVSELEIEKNQLKEQLLELTTKLENVENNGDVTSNLLVKRSELKLKEYESKLELEQTTRNRLDIQIQRLKEAIDKLQNELVHAQLKDQQNQEHIRKLQRNIRDLKDELNQTINKELDSIQKKKEFEKKCESLESESKRLKGDLKLALKRIEDLQTAIQGDLENSTSENNSDSDEIDDQGSSDESFNTFIGKHEQYGLVSSSKTPSRSSTLNNSTSTIITETITKSDTTLA